MEPSPWMHGGLTPDGVLPDASVLDLSVNINPYGPDADLRTFLSRQAFDQYPDPQQTELREGLARMSGRAAEEILVGNGCNELFWAAARAFLKPGLRWIAIEPNYSEFARAAARTGAEKIVLRAREEDLFHWSLDELKGLLEHHQPALVMTSNPCSPTGFFQDMIGFSGVAQAFPRTLFCLDLSFLNLSPHWRSSSLIEWPSNVLRFHSLTKDFAIAGLRLGYVEAHPVLVHEMAQEIPTWSVNSLAQAAGIWITQNHERLAESRQLLLEDRQRLEEGLQERAFYFAPSQTVFTMLRSPRAAELIAGLWQHHRILLRSCASYGLPHWLRVAARPQPELQRFWKALDEEFSCQA
ncbi:pyridoxal phosphate-dependent aminotransferase [Oligoflexus tunisiensis]|uniref:pyridoxal phosphate-dependent aminotransferase n=1 Tax=Oligoflexus tunisiensis TaxID=708132 RepID=UPI00159EFA48|nr:histidinol-phosphate transaminase [Oligoflexus tunisiensis]